MGAHGGNQEPPSRGSDTQSAFCPTLAPLQTPATPTAPATLSLGNPVPTRIAEPWGYSSAQGHCPNPYLYPYPSSIRVESDRGDGRGHTTGERPHYWGEATPPTPSHTGPLARSGTSRAKWDLSREVRPLARSATSCAKWDLSREPWPLRAKRESPLGRTAPCHLTLAQDLTHIQVRAGPATRHEADRCEGMRKARNLSIAGLSEVFSRTQRVSR